MKCSWKIEGVPSKNQIVLIAIAQPEDLTGPEDEPPPVWVGYWDGALWLTDQGDRAEVIAWMELPIPPIVALGETYIEGANPPKILSKTEVQFHVESFGVKDVGTFFAVKCGEQMLAIRGNKVAATVLAQQLKEEAAT